MKNFKNSKIQIIFKLRLSIRKYFITDELKKDKRWTQNHKASLILNKDKKKRFAFVDRVISRKFQILLIFSF